jgi:hypothetical protein
VRPQRPVYRWFTEAASTRRTKIGRFEAESWPPDPFLKTPAEAQKQ